MSMANSLVKSKFAQFIKHKNECSREAVLNQTLGAEDLESTAVIANSPLRKSKDSKKLTQALNSLRQQTAKHVPNMGTMRNDAFRTVASTPKSRKLSFGGDMSDAFTNGLSANQTATGFHSTINFN